MRRDRSEPIGTIFRVFDTFDAYRSGHVFPGDDRRDSFVAVLPGEFLVVLRDLHRDDVTRGMYLCLRLPTGDLVASGIFDDAMVRLR